MGNQLGQPKDLEPFKKYSGMTIKHVTIIRERLELLSNTDLSISKEAFQLAMKTREEETDRIFRIFDLSSTQKIEVLEFICALSLTSFATLKEKCELLFGLYDFDKNRTMNYQELIILIKTVLTTLNAIASKGECPIQEAVSIAQNIIDRYDTNKDNSISGKEFYSFVSKDPDIVKMLLSYGLISIQDLRFNFGEIKNQDINVPEADSDLEDEIFKSKLVKSENDELRAVDIFQNNENNNNKIDDLNWYKQLKKENQLFEKNEMNGNPPDSTLELEHVYGFRCYDTRNNVKYSQDGELLYHTGSLIIKDNGEKQEFYMEHTDEITCIDTWEYYVVTGQMGRKPSIFVWDSRTMETKAVFRGALIIGVSNICISNDGKKVAAIGMDEDQCVVIYDIERAIINRLSGKRDECLIANGKGPIVEIFDIKFDKSDKQVIIACMGEVNFVSFDNNVLKIIKGTWDSNLCPYQAVLSIGLMESAVVVGTFKGYLLLWRVSRISMPKKDAHKGPITCLHTQKDSLIIISGGKDGFIRFWDYTLKLTKEFNLDNINLKQITSLCSYGGQQLLIGTRGGQIVEIKDGLQEIRVNSHFQGKLEALAVHPTKDLFYTSAEDQMLMLWNIEQRKLKKGKKIDYQIKVLDVCEKFLVGGCTNGNILIIEPIELNIQREIKDRESEITCLRIIEEYLVVFYGSPYFEFMIYSIKQKFKKINSIIGKPCKCISIDYSKNKNILITFEDQQIFCLDLDYKKIIPYKDDDWKTFTSTYGWQVVGIWPKNSDGTEITALHRNEAKNVIAVGDKYGQIKLFRYPTQKIESSYYKYSGHCGKIAKLRFSSNDKYVISIGENEKNIIQWRYEIEDGLQEKNISQKTIKKEQIKENDNQQILKQEQINKPFIDILKLNNTEELQEQLIEVPNQYMNLKYVFGVQTEYKTQQIYSQVKYAGNMKIVFPIGCLCVVQDTKQDQQSIFRKQQFYTGHQEYIISLVVHPKGQIIATGSCNKEINIWDVETRNTLVEIRGFHTQGINHLQFNSDGTLLLTTGLDKFNSLCIYDWLANRIVSSSKIDENRITDCCFLGQSDLLSFVTVGKFVRIWQIKGRNLSFDQFNKKTSAVTYAFNSDIVFGTEEGELFLMKNKHIPIDAHKGRVNIMISLKQNLLTGGDDGKIISWQYIQNQLQLSNQFCESATPSILSIDAKNDNILYLTQGCDIKELGISALMHSVDLLKAHSQEINSMAIQGNKIYTCSNDCTIKIWDIKTRYQLAVSEPFQYKLKSIDVYQGRVVCGDERCNLYLMDEKLNQLNQVMANFNGKQKLNIFEISIIKFSPDGSKIAVGAIGGASHIEIWSRSQDKLDKDKLITISAGFTGGILKIDWCIDNQTLIASSNNYELKCISLQRMKDIPFNFDIKLQTFSCQFGIGLQYIYPNEVGEDVSTVALFNDLLLVGDKFGLIKMYKYPTTSKTNRCFKGHGGCVNEIQFCLDGKFAISIGTQSIMLWQIEIDEISEYDQELLKQIPKQNLDGFQSKKVGLEKYEQQQSIEEIESQLIISKPWVDNIKEPTNYYKDQINQNTPPLIDLEIDYVFGYRGNDCNNNIKFLKSGCIVYHTASLGITLDLQTSQQKIFDLHTDDIISLDVHRDGLRVATGEVNTGLIYVWDSNTLQPLCKFTQLTNGIRSLHFSPNYYLIALSMDQQSTIAVFDLNTKNEIGGGQSTISHAAGKQIIFEIKWINDEIFYTIGPKYIKQWNINSSLQITQIINKEQIIFSTFIINEETLYLGDNKGILYIYKQKQNQKGQFILEEEDSFKNHTQAIDAIAVTNEYLLTGSKDQFIIIYDKKKLNQDDFILKFKLLELNKSAFCPQIKSLVLNEDKLIVGTFGCEIWELVNKDQLFNNQTKFTVKVLMKGHYAPSNLSELWGLAIEGDFAYTCGDDATLRQWSISLKKQINFIKTVQDYNFAEIKPEENGQYPDSIRGRSIAANIDYVIVGFKDGGVRIYDKELKQKFYTKIGKAWISDIKFSPNNEFVIFGSHDNCIYIYSLADMTQYGKPLRKHSSFIKNLDFSIDGTKLISTCGQFDLIYWDIIQGKQLPQGRNTLRNEKWQTWTNTVGWPIQGIWKENYEGWEINCVCRSNNPFATKSPDDYYIVAVGNDFNQILLYRYPCINKKSEPIIRRGHSSPVIQIKFSADDKYLVSIGGEDMTVILWRVIRKI